MNFESNKFMLDLQNNYHFENISYSGTICEKQGVYQTYYSNGNVKTSKNYGNGKLHVLYYTYDLYGNILSVHKYNHGLKIQE